MEWIARKRGRSVGVATAWRSGREKARSNIACAGPSSLICWSLLELAGLCWTRPGRCGMYTVQAVGSVACAEKPKGLVMHQHGTNASTGSRHAGTPCTQLGTALSFSSLRAGCWAPIGPGLNHSPHRLLRRHLPLPLPIAPLPHCPIARSPAPHAYRIHLLPPHIPFRLPSDPQLHPTGDFARRPSMPPSALHPL